MIGDKQTFRGDGKLMAINDVPVEEPTSQDSHNPETADSELFQDAFYEWLSVHGVRLGELVGDKFVATIDINELKVAIMRLKL